MGPGIREAEGGCTVEVKVTPRSGRSGVEIRADVITIRVQAPPEGGKATREARGLLAEALRVAPSAITLRAGRRSRTKVFHVAGRAAAEADRLLAEGSDRP